MPSAQHTRRLNQIMDNFVREHSRASGMVNFHRNESVSMLIKPVKPKRLTAIGFDDELDFDESGLYEETEADDVLAPRPVLVPSREREDAYWSFLSVQMRTVLQKIVGYSELIELDLRQGSFTSPIDDLLKIRSASTDLLEMAEQIEQLLHEERGKRHVAERLGSMSRQLNYAPERENIYASMLSNIASLVPFKEACVFENSTSDWELAARWGKHGEVGEVTVMMACSAVARTLSPCIQPMHGGGELMTFPLNVDGLCVAALTLRGDFAREDQAHYAGVVMAFVHQVERALSGWREMDQIKREAMYDGLTGALNRRTFFTMAGEVTGERTVIMLDIDHFKRINDTHGHGGGDAVLREVVRRIHGTLRDRDLVGRYGGEEFALCLGVGDEDLAVEIAERIRLAISDTPICLPDGEHVEVTASLGVVTGSEPLEELLGVADELLYQAKREGRDRVCSVSHCELTLRSS